MFLETNELVPEVHAPVAKESLDSQAAEIISTLSGDAKFMSALADMLSTTGELNGLSIHLVSMAQGKHIIGSSHN